MEYRTIMKSTSTSKYLWQARQKTQKQATTVTPTL